MLVNQTVENLRRMRLTGMAEAFLAQNQDPGYRELSFEERFGLLVDQESTYREDRRLKRLLAGAHLKTQACVEDFDYRQSRGLDRSVMAGLSTCQWVRDHRNVLITGPTGVGKTFVACALGNLACRNGFSSRYYRLPRLLMDLGIARGDGSYPSFMRKLAKTELLLLDDWGLGPLAAAESRELLEVLEDRCQTKSTLVASQVLVDKWYELMPDSTVADAIMDRLVHNAHKIALRGESMRKIAAAGGKEGGES
ncbi:MAG: ATP-binding protein [Firmicutes bacterium]|nr:ATP-binding protein [Candidatus Fermentithermobacillaceae bacterium]